MNPHSHHHLVPKTVRCELLKFLKWLFVVFVISSCATFIAMFVVYITTDAVEDLAFDIWLYAFVLTVVRHLHTFPLLRLHYAEFEAQDRRSVNNPHVVVMSEAEWLVGEHKGLNALVVGDIDGANCVESFDDAIKLIHAKDPLGFYRVAFIDELYFRLVVKQRYASTIRTTLFIEEEGYRQQEPQLFVCSACNV